MEVPPSTAVAPVAQVIAYRVSEVSLGVKNARQNYERPAIHHSYTPDLLQAMPASCRKAARRTQLFPPKQLPSLREAHPRRSCIQSRPFMRLFSLSRSFIYSVASPHE